MLCYVMFRPWTFQPLVISTIGRFGHMLVVSAKAKDVSAPLSRFSHSTYKQSNVATKRKWPDHKAVI